MPSKRSMAADQKRISAPEFKKLGVTGAVKRWLKSAEDNILANLQLVVSKQVVNRIRFSARCQKTTPLGLLVKLAKKA